MSKSSRINIEDWTIKQNKLERSVFIQRLRSYVGSLVLGREFGESAEDYFQRRGLTEFVTWAHEILKNG